MAFGMSGLGNHNHTTAAGTGGNVSVSDAGSQGRLAREIQSLKPGQTMSGEVLAKNGSEVQIRIDADTIMTARLEKDINLTLGQNMTFEVKSNTGAQLALRPLFENTALDANGMRALQQAALPVNQKTLAMVSALMEQGMGIDRKTLQSVYRDMMTNTGSRPADVVALHKLQVPVTQESLQQIEGYRNFEHQLVRGIDTIAESMKDTLLDLVKGGGEGNVQDAANLLRDMIRIITAGSTENTEGVLAENRQIQDGSSVKGAEGAADPLPGDLQENAQGTSAKTIIAGEAAEMIGTLNAEETIRPEENGDRQTAQPDKAVQEGLQESVKTTGQTGAAVTQGLLAGRDKTPLMSEAQRNTFANQLEAFGISREIADQVRTGRIGAGELLEHIAQTLSGGKASRESITSLLTGKGMQQLLKGQIENNWLLTPQQAASKEEVEKLYSRLREQTGKLAQVLSDAGKGGTELAKGVQNLKENVDFIQQLNQNFTYLQLPLKRFGKNAHGDLYVYTNKKNLAKKDGNVSALLHLDMEFIGSMDIYVSMQRDRVSTKFYLQKEEMLDFLESNIPILNERLEQRGYTMNTQVVYQEQKANIASEMMKQEGETSMLSMFSFDVRA